MRTFRGASFHLFNTAHTLRSTFGRVDVQLGKANAHSRALISHWSNPFGKGVANCALHIAQVLTHPSKPRCLRLVWEEESLSILFPLGESC